MERLKGYVQSGDVDMVKIETKYNNISKEDADWMIKIAAEYGYLELVKHFVHLGADIRLNDDYCLKWSSTNNHIDVVQYCLEQCANAKAQDSYALRFASANFHWQVCDLLLDNGADIHAIKEDAGYKEETIRWKNLKILNERLNKEVSNKKVNKSAYKI